MNEKERIIELVKQNVITMDEALRLLEASAQSKANAADPDANVTERVSETAGEPSSAEASATLDSEQIKATVQDVIDKGLKFGQEIIYSVQQNFEVEEREQAEEAVDLPLTDEEEAVQRTALKDTLKKEGEALLIAKQRLRELEILAELDELSDELKTQKEQLASEVLARGQEVDQLQSQLQALKGKKVVTSFEQKVDAFANRVEVQTTRAAQKVSQVANQAGAQLDRESNRLGRVLGQAVSGAFKVARESIRVGARAYSRWRHEWEHRFTFDAQDLQVIDLKYLQGDVTIRTAAVSEVTLDVEATFFGKIPEPSLADFEAHSVLSLEEGTLLFHLTSAQMASDVVITLPETALKSLRIETTDGDIELEGLQVENIKLTTVNGDVQLHQVKVTDLLDFNSTNGDFEYTGADVARFSLETTNGDGRIVGQIGDVVASSISGDVLVTKQDDQGSAMKVNTVSGDIKVAIPAQLSLDGVASSSHGDVLHRYGHLDVQTRRHHSLEFQRTMTDQERPVHLDLTTISGDIRLKDSD